MDIRSLPSKTPSRLQHPYYSKALLSKESPKASTSPSLRRRHSLVNGFKSSVVNGDSVCSNETNSPRHKSRDISSRLPTLFNFRPGKTYYSPSLERSVCRSETPAFMNIVEPPSSDSVIEHAIRIMESRKRIQSVHDLDTNCSATNQHDMNPDWNEAKRRRMNQVPQPRLPDISAVGSSKETDCFSCTSLHQLTHNKSNQIGHDETVSYTSKSVQTQNMTNNHSDSSLANSGASKDEDNAAALRRRIPYMSPAELEAHLLSTKALKTPQSKPIITDDADIDEDFEFTPMVNNRKKASARRQLTQKESLSPISPKLDDTPTLGSDTSPTTQDTATDLDQPSIISRTNSLAKFISDLENHSFNNSLRSSSSDLASKVTKYTPKSSDVAANPQSDLDSRVQRIRSLLSRSSPDPNNLGSQTKVNSLTSLPFLPTATSTVAFSTMTTAVDLNKVSNASATSTSGFALPSFSATSTAFPNKPFSSPNLFSTPKSADVSSTLTAPISSIIPTTTSSISTTLSFTPTTSTNNISATTMSSPILITTIPSTSTISTTSTPLSVPAIQTAPTSIITQSPIGNTSSSASSFSFGLPKSTTTVSTLPGFGTGVSTSSVSFASITSTSLSTNANNLSSTTVQSNSGFATTTPAVFSFQAKPSVATSDTVKTSDSQAPSAASNLFNFTASALKPKSDANTPVFGSFAASTSSSIATPPQPAFTLPQSTFNQTAPNSAVTTTTSTNLSSLIASTTTPSSNAFQFPFSGFGSGVLGATSQANATSTTPSTTSAPSFQSFLPSVSKPSSSVASSTFIPAATTTGTSLFSFGSTVATNPVSTQSAPTFTGFNFADTKTPKLSLTTTNSQGISQTSSGLTSIFTSPSNTTSSNLFGAPALTSTTSATTAPASNLFGSGFPTSNLFAPQKATSTTAATSTPSSFPFSVPTTAPTAGGNIFGTVTSTQPPSIASNNLFTLGVKPVSTPPVSTKPVPLFGSNPTSTMLFSSSIAAATTNATSAITGLSSSPVFSFSANPTGLTSSATAPAQLFQFGSTNAFTAPTATTTAATAQPFNFGSSTPAFSFGQTSQPQAQTTTQPSFGAPIFGASTTPATTSATVGGFNFAAAATAAVPSFGATTSTNPAPTFGGFNFGMTQPAAATTMASSPSGFVFGQTAPSAPSDPNAANPFTFGTSATNTSTVPRRRPLSSRRSRRP